VIVTLIIAVAILTAGSAVINYFLVGRPRSSLHTIALGGVIVGAGLALLLNVRSLWRADNLQNQLAALSEKSMWRTLTSAQQETIASQMQQFTGAEYDASVPDGDPEARDLLPLIEKSLDDAGWKEVVCAFGKTLVINRDNKPPVCLRPPGMKDVTVAFAPERASRLEHIASALASALTAEGISATFGSGNVSYQTDAIHILIGRKT
jgi:hypothetical protein